MLTDPDETKTGPLFFGFPVRQSKKGKFSTIPCQTLWRQYLALRRKSGPQKGTEKLVRVIQRRGI